MAPEIFVREPYEPEGTDLFAAGVILYMMLTGLPPFPSADPRKTSNYSYFAHNMMDEFWQQNEPLLFQRGIQLTKEIK